MSQDHQVDQKQLTGTKITLISDGLRRYKTAGLQ